MREVLASLETACRIEPQNDLAAYWYVQMLLNAHQPKRAAQVLEERTGILMRTPKQYSLLKSGLADMEKQPDWPDRLVDAVAALERRRAFLESESTEIRVGVLQLLDETGEPLVSVLNKGIQVSGPSVKVTEYEEGYVLIVSNIYTSDNTPIAVMSTGPSFLRGRWTYHLTGDQTAWLGTLKITKWSEQNKGKAGGIEGRVVRADGTPAQGIYVSCVFQPDGAPADNKQTDAEGAFAFSLAPGAYSVSCPNASPKTPARQVQVEEGKTTKMDFEVVEPPRPVRVSARFLINWSNAKAFADGEYEEVCRSLTLSSQSPGGYRGGYPGGYYGGGGSSLSVLQSFLTLDKGKVLFRRQEQGGSDCQSFLDLGKQGWEKTKSLPEKCRPAFGSITPPDKSDPVVLETGHVYVGCLMATLPYSHPSYGGGPQRGLVPFKLRIESLETVEPPKRP